MWGGVTSINGKTGALTMNNVAFSGNYDDLSNRPAIPASPNAYLVQTWSNGQNWWRKYSDGFIEQGGIVTNSGNGYTTTTINLNIAFRSTNYSVCPIGTWNDGTGKGSVIKGKTTTNFVVEWVTYISNRLYACWYACGY